MQDTLNLKERHYLEVPCNLNAVEEIRSNELSQRDKYQMLSGAEYEEALLRVHE